MFAEAVLVATETERRAMLRKHYTEHDPELDEAFKQKEVQTELVRKENSVNKSKGKKRSLSTVSMENKIIIFKHKTHLNASIHPRLHCNGEPLPPLLIHCLKILAIYRRKKRLNPPPPNKLYSFS